ncbi:MAG: peptide chain release factor N(5)-glutamine methyltransferase [Flavobacteriaceae bacterium]|nr:peptide chain release factor N(5)-glutamine methyltransferase [Flavobacteriaceae bacterium]
MTLKEFRNHFKSKLKDIYPEEEIGSFFYLLSEKYLLLPRFEVVFQLDLKLSIDDISKFDEALKKLEKEVPIQYILGETEFYGLPFKVNPSVLIPRPETEELVDWILNDYSKINEQFSLLDIGTGSGCIAISLAKKMRQAKVSAMDISPMALKTASENAILNDVTISILEKDILAIKELNSTFDVIVSNPPYVRNFEKEKMQSNVLLYEPHNALFVPDSDPLLFYKSIAEIACQSLKREGNLYFEINEAYGSEVVEMLEKMRFENVELKKDIFGKDRMIKAQKFH